MFDFFKQQFDKIMLGLLFLVMLGFIIWAYRWNLSELSSWLTNTAGAILGALLTLITGSRLAGRTADKNGGVQPQPPVLPPPGGPPAP